MVDSWPLSSFLGLGAFPGAVPCARLHAKQVVWEWGLTGLSENVELLVSELVTNGVAASRALGVPSPVRLWLLSDNARILILVQDASPHPPVRIEPGEYADSGRGLMLVETISERWGWQTAQGLRGKVVWALTGEQ